jgi:tetratricopeptide (TPR) repeat protein
MRWTLRIVAALCLISCGCGQGGTKQVTQTSENDYQQARTAFAERDYDSAARLLDSALRRGGLNADLAAEALLMRARSCIRLGRLNEALSDLEDAGRGPAPMEEVLAARGEVALLNGDHDLAKSLYAEARKIDASISLPDTLK